MTFTSFASLDFSEQMHMPDIGRCHKSCEKDKCQHLTIDQYTYKQRYVGDCNCEALSVPLDLVGPALDTGQFPPVQIRGHTLLSVRLDVECYVKNKPYVALSHVWADGLGDNIGNRLPRCQLLRLKQVLEELRQLVLRGSGGREDIEFSLWCDTLCVPIESQEDKGKSRLRDLAMQRMRMVYEKCALTVVLGLSMRSYAIRDIGPLEAAIRVIASPWMYRLWTLQEAILPPLLLVEFADGFIDFDTLLDTASTLDDRMALHEVTGDVMLQLKQKIRYMRASRF